MTHAIYVGPKEEYKGCGALVQECEPPEKLFVKVQFDKCEADPVMCYNWHVSLREDWKIDD